LTILLSMLAAVVFGTGVALQQRAAVTVPRRYAGKPGLVLRLVRRPMWLLGVCGDVCGLALQAAALRRGSLVVVQPLLTTSLLFTLTLTAAWSHQPITRPEWGALVMILAGLALFLAAASPPDNPTPDADLRGWLLCVAWVGGLAALALAAGLRAEGTGRAAFFGVAAGMANAFMAVLVKAFAGTFGVGFPGILTTWPIYALIGAGIIALILIQTAYQAGHPTVAFPVITVVDPLVASLIGVTLFGERVMMGGVRAPLIALASLGIVTGLVTLSRTASLSHMSPTAAPERG
jgi:drug/metabolite transporter (DMT)-like permease